MPSYQKVTPIEDLLPDIDEVAGSKNSQLTPEQTKLSRRFIRNHAQILPESGMILQPYNQPAEEVEEATPPSTTQNNFFENSPIIEIPAQQHMAYRMTCQDIFYHIDSCPLCKKFYKQDNTVYLVIIAILVLACALLLKKVLSE